MVPLTTRLTSLLGVRTPVISAPMAGASGGELAAAVAQGGGFGFIQAGYQSKQKLKEELEKAKAILGVSSLQRAPIGVGFISWILEAEGASSNDLLDTALESRVNAIWLAFGNDIGRWVAYVREYDRRQADGHKTLVFVQLSSEEEAAGAVNNWKVDVLVAQGIEAGGHGRASAPPLLTLISSLLNTIPEEGPPIVAAGGLANGAHVAACLTLGASGVAMGTRFLLTPESLYTDAQKKALISAGSNSTVRTLAFDRARGTLGWPTGIDGRALMNQTVKDLEAGVPIEEVQKLFQRSIQDGDPDRMLVWAGTGVALMNQIKGAANVVTELHQETVQHLERAVFIRSAA
ncbi:2-nitropropane dioxygenase [Gloeophyllum trabeum ATCC 11539]|uniref:2-nitropropane dioxygenase n=1 Tax=Gloeophyllum trabeum (strain ATCC 11539 / FP-39264 / Madison 617) TaxID=670483 RepID=S7RTE6_GLOTA|nr:2-nitropropane dioxygenase [Gloeophyllum trabeum ATCC 11539]EPQ56409.1 2-nitropropane dioxygenase [Gloeophyllum trabeum ATCC 11539]